MTYKLISIDCDGTLLNSKKQISERNVAMLKKAKEKNIRIVIASARPYYRLLGYLNQLDLIDNSQYTIAFNGALIINNGTQKEIFEKAFSKKDISYLLSLAEKYNKHVFLYAKDGILANYYDEKYVEKNPDTHYECVDLSNYDFEKTKIYKLAFVNTPDVIVRIKDVLKTKIGSAYEVSSSVPQFVEVVNKGITKSFALRQICNILNIEKSEVIAFGDEDNDIPMMEFAGFSIAMGNASQKVKKMADYVSTSNDEDGVAFALEYVMNDNNG